MTNEPEETPEDKLKKPDAWKDFADLFKNKSRQLKGERKNRSARIERKKAELREEEQGLALAEEDFRSVLGKRLNDTKLQLSRGWLRPSIEKLHDEQIIMGVQDDHLLVIQPDAKGDLESHLLTPPDPGSTHRHCLWCGLMLDYPVVNVAVVIEEDAEETLKELAAAQQGRASGNGTETPNASAG